MKLIQHVWMACIGLCLFSCTQTDELETAQGKTGFIVSLTDGTKLDVSRATPGDIVDSEGIEGADFNLRIVNVETKEEIYNKKVGTGVIDAYSGVYDLTATYGENPVLALDAPYFKGETTGVEVFNDQTTPVTIACKVANALVSVTYDNSKASFDDVYSNYYVEVKVGSATPVQIDKTGEKSAYMQAGSAFEVIFHGTIDGTDKAVTLGSKFEVPTKLNAGDHLKLTLSPKLDRFDIPLSIEGVNVEEASLTEEIPMEWLPKPKVEAEGFTDNELSFVETEQKDAKLNLTLSSALQDIKFKFNFEDEQFAGVLPKEEYLLSNAEDKQAIETALGITLPAIGATEASIDLSALVSKLQTNAGTTTNNSIMIVPKANNRWSSEKLDVDSVYTFTCNKPDFSIAVQPGNVWTKTFTIDEPTVTAGNAETIKSKLKYQYKTENGEWQDCEQLVQFDSAPTEKSYQVRAIYREAIASEEVAVTLETPAQLPNSDMEEWQAPQLDSFVGIPNFWDKFYCYDFLPYKNGENDIWWSTNNKRSQDYTIARVKVTSSPCVSYSENVKNNGSRSTLIYTSGHGGEWASTSTELYSDGAFAGSLFIGKYNWNWDKSPQEEIISGHSFPSRPTSFKFWYKYVPKNSDTFKVYIELKNGDDVIASGTFIPQTISSETDWIEASIDLDYGDSPKTATSIYVQFLSTTKTFFSESDFDKNKSITFPVMGDWNAHIGSMLYIDDLSLIYDK